MFKTISFITQRIEFWSQVTGFFDHKSLLEGSYKKLFYIHEEHYNKRFQKVQNEGTKIAGKYFNKKLPNTSGKNVFSLRLIFYLNEYVSLTKYTIIMSDLKPHTFSSFRFRKYFLDSVSLKFAYSQLFLILVACSLRWKIGIENAIC